MTMQEHYMQRCIELAEKGAGHVAPNPMVGAMLVHDGKIIGEGWHQQYGQPHAEVNCIHDALNKGFNNLIASSVLYVSLEPCVHFGKTPPCADLIVRHKIPSVVIGCRDSFEAVNGRGVEKLRAAGVNVVAGILEKECRHLNRRFFTFHEKERPYIILKWAETTDGFIAKQEGAERLLISNEQTNQLVHKWRSEEAAILVGTNTAWKDNPQLTNRLWPGSTPVRLVLDKNLRLPSGLHVKDGKVKTIVFNEIENKGTENLIYHKMEKGVVLLPQMLTAIKNYNLLSVLIEGGAQLLQSFIDAGLWDEMRVIKSSIITAGGGIKAPLHTVKETSEMFEMGSDTVSIFFNDKN